MSIVSITVSRSGRSGSDSSSGPRTYERELIVITNNPRDGQTLIANDQRIPQPLTPYVWPGEVDLQARVSDRQFTQDESQPKVWRLRITWSTEATGPNGSSDLKTSEEIDLSAKYSWGSERESVPITHDIFGKPFVNSAGEMFDPPLTRPISLPVLRCTRPVLNFNPALANSYVDAINSQQWGPWPAYSVKCIELTATQEVQKGVRYWKETSAFAFKLREAPKNTVSNGQRRRTIVVKNKILGQVFDVTYDSSGGWVHYELDRGTMTRPVMKETISGTTPPVETGRLILGEPKPITDKTSGQLVSSPVLLDGAGGRLVADGTPLDMTSASSPKPVYIPFHIHPEKDFNALGIDPNPPA